MRLTLKNFRHHRDAVFDIPNEGLTLISGISGSGKSTILNAIFFALYGKFRRPYSHGTNTCSVTLEDSRTKVKIIRNCRPNRLIVSYDETDYEDDSAQGVIEKLYGMNLEEFQLSSYFDQKKHGSVMSMTPSEQLSFIELVAFSNDDHEKTKQKIKEHVKFLEKEQINLQAQLALIEKQIESKDFNENNLEIPNDMNPEEIREKYEDEKNKLKEIQNKLKIKSSIVEKLRKEEEENKKLKEDQSKLQLEIDHYSNLLDNLEKPKTEEDIEKLNKEADKKLRQSQLVLDLQESISLEKELDKLKKEYVNSLKDSLQTLEKNLIKEDEIKFVENSVNNYEENRKLFENAEDMANEKKKYTNLLAKTKKRVIESYETSAKTNKGIINFLEKKIKEFDQQRVITKNKLDLASEDSFQCPKCEACLKWDEEKECVVEYEPTENSEEVDIPGLEIELASINANIEILSSLLKDMKIFLEKASIKLPEIPKGYLSPKEFRSLSAKLSNNEDMKNEINKIKNTIKSVDEGKIPKSLSHIQIKIKEKKAGTEEVNVNMDVEKLQKESRKLQKESEEAWRIRGDYTNYTRELNSRKRILGETKKKFLKPNKKASSLEESEKEVSKLQKSYSKCTDLLEEIINDIRIIESVEAVNREQKELKKLLEMKKEIVEQELIVQNRLQGSYGLETAARDAEFKSLEKTIGSINEHAKIYLEQMFEDDISVRLIVKKYTKKGASVSKPSIRVVVSKNGHKYDEIDDLSGGERQRCDMAFLLAVNDMLGSNMILLDECLNNLDGELNMDILTFVKELCGDKQVLVVAHEAIVGIFDHSIQL